MNVGGLEGKHQKYIVCNWLKSISSPPIIIGLKELKTSHFLTTIALNAIKIDYQWAVSLPFEGREGQPSCITPHYKWLTLELWAKAGLYGHNFRWTPPPSLWLSFMPLATLPKTEPSYGTNSRLDSQMGTRYSWEISIWPKTLLTPRFQPHFCKGANRKHGGS